MRDLRELNGSRIGQVLIRMHGAPGAFGDLWEGAVMVLDVPKQGVRRGGGLVLVVQHFPLHLVLLLLGLH